MSTETNKEKDPAAVSLGRRGGKAGRGAVKRRTREQAAKAAFARWAQPRIPTPDKSG